MRIRYTPVLLAACLFGPGCSFVGIIKQNLYLEPKRLFEDRILVKRHERLAQLAWDEMIAQYGCEFSEDYHTGFIDGFVDYLTFGGTAPEGFGDQPLVPAVPPPHYRRLKGMSPEGLKGAEDWFAGFRHGSSTALASGLRKLVEVPVFDRPNPATQEFGRFRELPGRTPSGDTTNPTAPEGETLPAPRPVPSGEGDTRPANPAPPANPMAPGGPAIPPVGPGGIPPVGPGQPPPG